MKSGTNRKWGGKMIRMHGESINVTLVTGIFDISEPTSDVK